MKSRSKNCAPAVVSSLRCRARQVTAGEFFLMRVPCVTVGSVSPRGGRRRAKREEGQQTFCAGGVTDDHAGRDESPPAHTFGVGPMLSVVEMRNEHLV